MQPFFNHNEIVQKTKFSQPEPNLNFINLYLNMIHSASIEPFIFNHIENKPGKLTKM